MRLRFYLPHARALVVVSSAPVSPDVSFSIPKLLPAAAEIRILAHEGGVL